MAGLGLTRRAGGGRAGGPGRAKLISLAHGGCLCAGLKNDPLALETMICGVIPLLLIILIITYLVRFKSF